MDDGMGKTMNRPGWGHITLVSAMLTLETWGIIVVLRHGRWFTCGSLFVSFVGATVVVSLALWIWSVFTR